VDIGAGTDYPLIPGEILVWEVDNTFPGGAPRTPGYWKNWNRCSGGGQQYTSDDNGGWEEGFWLLEHVLDPDIGGGVIWDDMLDDDFLYPITTCDQAVLILNQQDAFTGKKRSSDKAYTLAMHLLAANLNFASGAETCQAALDAAMEGEMLLDLLNFDGSGAYLKNNSPGREAVSRRSSEDWAALAGELAELLDQYNNGELCTP
jgi:hypothetical protein